MKKGCFISAVVIFTLVVITVVYLFKTKGNFLKEYGKTRIFNIAVNNFDDKLKNVEPSLYKDSLKIALHNFVGKIEQIPFDSAMEQLQSVMNEAAFFVHDGKVDSVDFNELKKVIKRYERSKKN